MAKQAYQSSIYQFEISSKASDSQFKQIEGILKSYQKNIDSSLLVTNSQLLISRKLLDQQIISYKPNVGINQTEYYIKETENNKKRLGTLITIINTGGRTAHKVLTQFSYFDSKYQLLHNFKSKVIDIIPNTPKTIFEEVIFSSNSNLEYYLRIDIEYYDSDSKKKFNFSSILKPSKFASTYEEVEVNIKNQLLNRQLKLN